MKQKILSSDSINLENLKTIELINGEPGKYQPLSFTPNPEGLTVTLPERTVLAGTFPRRTESRNYCFNNLLS